MVLIAATLLGSMGAWGRFIFRYEPDPMLVVTWRALFGTLALAAVRPALLCIRPRDLPFFLLYGFTGITLSDPNWPSPNLTLLNKALRQTGWQRRPLSEDTWREVVRKRLATVAWGQAVVDIRPFLEPSADRALVTHENLARLLSARRP